MRTCLIITLLLMLSGCTFINPIVEWEDGYIPYYYTGTFTSTDVLTVEAAMDEWEACCGVRFEEVLPQSWAYNIIRVKKSTQWASTIGENNVQSYMYYGDGSGAYGHTLHELGHCIGLIHEHQRPDRDLYVTIDWDNILPEYEHNFDIRDNPLIREEDFEYDYDSIMHYNSSAFSINGEETIIPNPPHEIGRTDQLTDIDKAKAHYIYGAPLED